MSTELLPLRAALVETGRDIANAISRARALLPRDGYCEVAGLWRNLERACRRAGQTVGGADQLTVFYASVVGYSRVWEELEPIVAPCTAIERFPSSDLARLESDLRQAMLASIGMRDHALETAPEECLCDASNVQPCHCMLDHVRALADRSELVAAALSGEVPGIHGAWVREWCKQNEFWAIGRDALPY